MNGTLRTPPNRPPPMVGRSPPDGGGRTLQKGGERLKHTKKRLWSVLLTLALLVGLLPGLTLDAQAVGENISGLTLFGMDSIEAGRTYDDQFEIDEYETHLIDGGSFSADVDGSTVTLTMNDVVDTPEWNAIELSDSITSLIFALSGDSIINPYGNGIAGSVVTSLTFLTSSGTPSLSLNAQEIGAILPALTEIIVDGVAVSIAACGDVFSTDGSVTVTVRNGGSLRVEADGEAYAFTSSFTPGENTKAYHFTAGYENDELVITRGEEFAEEERNSATLVLFAYAAPETPSEPSEPDPTTDPTDPADPAPADDAEDLGGITGADFGNLSFAVSMANKSSYTGVRDPSSYTYRVAYRKPEEAVHPEVRFAANNDDTLSLSFNKNDGGTAEVAVVLLSITKPEGVEDGIYSYTLSQSQSEDQHNAGFAAKNSQKISGTYVTAYTLKLRVSDGKITQAILTDGENKHTGFEIEFARADGTYAVTLAKRSVSGVEGTFTFDVEFTLPENHTSADIAIEGYSGTITFDSHRRATAQGVSVTVGSQVDITGIPAGTVLRVKETGALDVYKVTSVVEHLSNATNLTTGREADGYTTCGTVTGNGGLITYYNEFGEISLTGVSLRYAPYLAMLGAGLAVSGLSVMRRREEEI